ncbi:uncharacterized protein YALI1_A11821g [Yarrowia lipolytica]|uniref:Uncharacterized protein n=1 Tax=Yarrowia lipolytica TaxID=4952 RepID=A0A1D8N4I2_YARLL|nr:hypothetical protein YALI1_A11821g [Yarrowia lipolytica]
MPVRRNEAHYIDRRITPMDSIGALYIDKLIVDVLCFNVALLEVNNCSNHEPASPILLRLKVGIYWSPHAFAVQSTASTNKELLANIIAPVLPHIPNVMCTCWFQHQRVCEN